VNNSPQPLVDNSATPTTFGARAPRQSTSDPAANGRNFPARAQPPGDSNPATACTVDPVDLHILYRATVQQLEWFGKLVLEGKHLEAVHEFTRYVLAARIPHLLRRYPAEGTLKVDGAFLDWRVRELQRDVQAQYVTGKAPGLPASELTTIDHKLNLIAGQLAKLTFLHEQNKMN